MGGVFRAVSEKQGEELGVGDELSVQEHSQQPEPQHRRTKGSFSFLSYQLHQQPIINNPEQFYRRNSKPFTDMILDPVLKILMQLINGHDIVFDIDGVDIVQ